MALTKIKPMKPGSIVMDPETRKAIPQDGKMVILNSYWERRIIDGSAQIVIEKPKQIKKQKPIQEDD